MLGKMVYQIFLLLNAFEMLLESWISTRNSKELLRRGAVEIAPRLLPLMAGTYALMYVGSWMEYVLIPRRIEIVWAISFGLLFLLAKLLKFWAISSLGSFWTMRVLVVPETQVVIRGPYRWIRHPNYVAVLMEIAATTLLGKSFITMAVVLTAFSIVLYFRIKEEENALKQLTDYSEHMIPRNRFLPLVILVLFYASTAAAETQNYTVSSKLSQLTFDVSAQMHQVHGVSKQFSGSVSGDPVDITTAKITVRLDPSTFDTDNKKRDGVMREKSLEIEKFPFIEFESNLIETTTRSLGVNAPVDAVIHGVLRLHGVEKEISVPVRILWDERTVVADGSIDLKLDDYTIFRPKVLFFRLQNDIKIRFRIAAERVL